MLFDLRISDDKVLYNFDRKAAKVSTLSSDGIGWNEYLYGEVLNPTDIAEKLPLRKFSHYSLGKAII